MKEWNKTTTFIKQVLYFKNIYNTCQNSMKQIIIIKCSKEIVTPSYLLTICKCNNNKKFSETRASEKLVNNIYIIYCIYEINDGNIKSVHCGTYSVTTAHKIFATWQAR
ncbi:hypothetical protein ILUMI_07963 [Ignelater luminosus]|uniref:Uncharacterized protein n=1 Tax=Ignelater luminosus TaxID=2038154 RepID=A0A8K0GDV7_IGNLU|nr:hypothetical protein ILUMI_07963 [Ignelater luminosus]